MTYKYASLFILFVSTLPAQDSLNMERIAQWDAGSGFVYNDIWGFTASDGTEYAVLGSRTKIHILSLADPANPQEVLSYTGGNSATWRDFKVHQDYLYAVCDGCSEGMHIFDLSALPGGSAVHIASMNNYFSSAHNIFIDTSSNRLYAAGTDTYNEGLVVLNLDNPASPALLKNHLFTDPGNFYVHDLYVRSDTAYCSHGNQGYYVWDMNDLNLVEYLGSYDSPGYNHSSWNHNDEPYAYYAEEWPPGRPLAVIDLSNLGSLSQDIQLIRTFRDPLSNTQVNVIPHNPFVKDDSLFISYYEDGLKAYDISNPTDPRLMAYYDTYPDNGSNYNGFNGAWGVYPFLPSGHHIVSDLKYGLVVLKVQQCASPVSYYRDRDGDGYGDPGVWAQSCSTPGGWVSNDLDCDDTDDTIAPNAPEICDNKDNDCDGLTDDQDPDVIFSVFYADNDNDGFGDINHTIQDCEPPVGYVSDSTDCDDTSNMVNPEFHEICDNLDNDCDGLVDAADPDLSSINWYRDADNDGYGDELDILFQCEQPMGYVAFSNDCDDTNDMVFPGNVESCDGIDNDCDTEIDEGCLFLPPCDGAILYVNPVADEEYHAKDTLHSDGLVEDMDDVSFYSGDVIELDGGFEVSLNAQFLASIEDCELTGNSPDTSPVIETHASIQLREDAFGNRLSDDELLFVFKSVDLEKPLSCIGIEKANSYFKLLKTESQDFKLYIFKNGKLIQKL